MTNQQILKIACKYRPDLYQGVRTAAKSFQHLFPLPPGLVSAVSSKLHWGIEPAYAFCVSLLEDVNAHQEAAAVERLLSRYLTKYVGGMDKAAQGTAVCSGKVAIGPKIRTEKWQKQNPGKVLQRFGDWGFQFGSETKVFGGRFDDAQRQALQYARSICYTGDIWVVNV